MQKTVESFLEQFSEQIAFAQVLIRKSGGGRFLCCHVSDAAISPDQLRAVPLNEIRSLAQFTETGQFRPLKSAPDLKRGWCIQVTSAQDLEFLLNQIYPGALADWSALQQGKALPTDYRPFTNRQTGMYRLTQKLDDAQVIRVIEATCHPDSCLKCRLWTIGSYRVDAPSEKSLIPCLEPCALLLEMARRSMRIEQENKTDFQFAPSELKTLAAALENVLLAFPDAGGADFQKPLNPRRARLLLVKIKETVQTFPPPASTEEDH